METLTQKPPAVRVKVYHAWNRFAWSVHRGPIGRAYDAWKYRGLPPALIKAIEDHFDYALGLRNGQVIEFSEARLCRPFVFLDGVQASTIKALGYDRPNFERGLDVRISEIAWVADAPHGS
jgi:hypothetical protein